jgi:hypothetical protein
MPCNFRPLQLARAEEPYEGPETHSIYVRDSTGIHKIR